MHTVPNPFFGTFFKIAVCSIRRQKKIWRHISAHRPRPIVLGTWLATFLRRLADLSSRIFFGRRIQAIEKRQQIIPGQAPDVETPTIDSTDQRHRRSADQLTLSTPR